MTDDNNTASDDSQIDEDVLSYTVSDEALEAEAAIERGMIQVCRAPMWPTYHPWPGCRFEFPVLT
jgi:hypothetical protein